MRMSRAGMEELRLVEKRQAIDDRLDTLEKQIKRLFAEIHDANKLADKRNKENNMGKITMGFEEQLKKVLDRLGKLEDSLTTPAPDDKDADSKVTRIFDIINEQMQIGVSAGNGFSGDLKRGIRKALNEFYTQRRGDSDVEVQLASALEIEKAARAEHARISEELVKEKDQHQMHILELNRARDEVLRLQQEIEDMDSLRNNVDQQIRINELEALNDGQATTILQLQRINDANNKLMNRVAGMVSDISDVIDDPDTMPIQAELMHERLDEMGDGPNYNSIAEDMDEA